MKSFWQRSSGVAKWSLFVDFSQALTTTDALQQEGPCSPCLRDFPHRVNRSVIISRKFHWSLFCDLWDTLLTDEQVYLKQLKLRF